MGECDVQTIDIRVTQSGKTRNYVSHAIEKFEEGFQTVRIYSSGRSICKAVTVAEIVKKQVPLLYQITEISAEECVQNMDTTRKSLLLIILSRSSLDRSHIGFQSCDNVKAVTQQGQPDDHTRQRKPKSRTPRYRKRKDIDNKKGIL